MKKRRLFLIILLTISLIGGFYIVFSKSLDAVYVKDLVEHDSDGKGILVDGRINIEKISVDKNFGNSVEGEVLFLLVGVDINTKGQIHNRVRTDTMMLVNINFNDGSIDLLSIPRDSKVKIKGKMDKLNHAHAYEGIDLTIKTIREMLNIDLDYYMSVDFRAVTEIIDAIGGIEYEVPEGINFEYGGVEVKEGKQILNGEKALTYLRHRKSYITGDLGRVKAQQQFLKKVVSDILKAENIVKLPNFLNTYFSKVKTNISFNQLLGIAMNASKLKGDSFKTYIVPGDGGYEDGVSYFFPDHDKTEELVKKIFPKYIIADLDEDNKSKDEKSIEEESDRRN